jgi:hypothetical protein
MRILTVHNRYKIRGSEDESRESEDRLSSSFPAAVWPNSHTATTPASASSPSGTSAAFAAA